MKFSIFIVMLWHKKVFGLVGGKNISSIHQAAFQANYADACGAVIIHSRWLLTTAHCGADGTFIRVGSIHHQSGTKVQIQKHIIHPSYTQDQFDYDIQLLRVYKELRFGRRLRSIGICEECGGGMEVFGWDMIRKKASGRSDARSKSCSYLAQRINIAIQRGNAASVLGTLPQSDELDQGDYNAQLQVIQVQRVSIEECGMVPQLLHHEIELTPRMFCAKGVGQDACQGDSGGAAISSSSSSPGLVGFSSFGYGCGRGYPGVYINVTESNIRNWIRNKTGV